MDKQTFDSWDDFIKSQEQDQEGANKLKQQKQELEQQKIKLQQQKLELEQKKLEAQQKKLRETHDNNERGLNCAAGVSLFFLFLVVLIEFIVFIVLIKNY